MKFFVFAEFRAPAGSNGCFSSRSPQTPRKTIPIADAVSCAEGNMMRRVMRAPLSTRRGQRTWHVRMFLVREPGDLQLDHLYGRPYREGEARSRIAPWIQSSELPNAPPPSRVSKTTFNAPRCALYRGRERCFVRRLQHQRRERAPMDRRHITVSQSAVADHATGLP
jgi:hypothetical protein